MKKCNKCGSINKDTDIFCADCGSELKKGAFLDPPIKIINETDYFTNIFYLVL